MCGLLWFLLIASLHSWVWRFVFTWELVLICQSAEPFIRLGESGLSLSEWSKNTIIAWGKRDGTRYLKVGGVIFRLRKFSSTLQTRHLCSCLFQFIELCSDFSKTFFASFFINYFPIPFLQSNLSRSLLSYTNIHTTTLSLSFCLTFSLTPSLSKPTQVSSSLSGCPIHIALCHICYLTKATN